ncbi:PTS system, mannose/fructose/sorbose family, IIA component [Raoultella ornithinolytica]|nr:PTS system, mannose/fructose/sorbose family, IIA component [Raoultella ornithinolytica]
MINVIVATHGPLANALLASGRMVYGELPHVFAVTLGEQAGIEGFREDFARRWPAPDKTPMACWCCAICKAVRRGT